MPIATRVTAPVRVEPALAKRGVDARAVVAHRDPHPGPVGRRLQHHPLARVVPRGAAYVVTRPLGASFADWSSKPHGDTGLGLGDGTVSAIELVLFTALVAYTAPGSRRLGPPPARRRAGRVDNG